MSRLAIITFLDGSGAPVDPGYGGGIAAGRPDNSLPGWIPPVDPGYGRPGISGGRPDQGLPGGGHIATLPVFPFDPTKPDGGLTPGNELPGGGGIRPGAKFVVKWLACTGLILVPDNELPEPTDPAQPK